MNLRGNFNKKLPALCTGKILYKGRGVLQLHAVPPLYFGTKKAPVGAFFVPLIDSDTLRSTSIIPWLRGTPDHHYRSDHPALRLKNRLAT
jgi:hypothetical protein